jgi:hypothetical protein
MSYVVTSEYELNRVVAPRLPTATKEYSENYINQLNNVLRLYFNQLDKILGQLSTSGGITGVRFPYGAFHDTTTQTAVATATAYAVTFNSTDLSNSVSVGSPTSRIVVDNAGIYNFQFSLQLDKSSGATGHTYIWARVNGTDVANSASEVAVQGTAAENIAAWNFVLEMNAGDYFQLIWSVDDTNIQIKAVTATAPVPAIPSAILTVTFVSALTA